MQWLYQSTHLLHPSPILVPALALVLVTPVHVPVLVLVLVLFLDTATGSDFEADLFCCAIRGKKWKERTGTCQIPKLVQRK